MLVQFFFRLLVFNFRNTWLWSTSCCLCFVGKKKNRLKVLCVISYPRTRAQRGSMARAFALPLTHKHDLLSSYIKVHTGDVSDCTSLCVYLLNTLIFLSLFQVYVHQHEQRPESINHLLECWQEVNSTVCISRCVLWSRGPHLFLLSAITTTGCSSCSRL